MKVNEFKMEEWTGNYQVIGEHDNLRILLLEIKTTDWKDDGRQNLIAVDENENIKWIVQRPSSGYQLGWYHKFKIEDNKLVGWYGGSWLVEINLKTGEIVKESFVW